VDRTDANVASDEERALTDEGRKKAAGAAKGLSVLDCRPRKIVTSPLVRCFETAKILADSLPGSPDVDKSDLLKPDAGVPDLARWLARQNGDLMLVGHMPGLGLLAGYLLTGSEYAVVAFRKSGACAISFDDHVKPGHGVLQWLLHPDHLRRIAKASK
jgi:phosphohistidine phosphatase